MYTYLEFQEIYRISRSLCKEEFRRVLKLGAIFARERKSDSVEIWVPCPKIVQEHYLPLNSWQDLVFGIVPRPALVFYEESSEFLAMSILERYSGHLGKLCLDFRITGLPDCSKWVDLLLTLSKRSTEVKE